ncbi:hypothetical protein FB451DRAFT_1283615 [Mycena latifolia]|nr:hypothetical protein FB451DRAFT_1283615 [Mycena latifolia]
MFLSSTTTMYSHFLYALALFVTVAISSSYPVLSSFLLLARLASVGLLTIVLATELANLQMVEDILCMIGTLGYIGLGYQLMPASASIGAGAIVYKGVFSYFGCVVIACWSARWENIVLVPIRAIGARWHAVSASIISFKEPPFNEQPRTIRMAHIANLSAQPPSLPPPPAPAPPDTATLSLRPPTLPPPPVPSENLGLDLSLD